MTLPENKMSETARAVGRERTTIIVAYIGFRPSWSSNVELILRWDVFDTILAEMKDIQMLQVSDRVGHASFSGRPTVTVCDNVNANGKAGRTRRLKTWN